LNNPPSTNSHHDRLDTLWLSASRGFISLRGRNYRLYWTGQVISTIGSWMQTTAQAWLVLKLTNDSPFALGLVIALQALPMMLFSLFGGILADRLPKRSTVVVTQTLLMLQASCFGALVATGMVQLWHVYILALVQGMINAVDSPVRQSFIYELAGRDTLVNAVGLSSLTFQSARIIGPAVAGVTISLIGFAPALILNAISFIPVIRALLLMDSKTFFAPPPPTQGSMFVKLKEGLGFAVHARAISSVLLVSAFIGMFGFNFTIFVPLVANNVLKTDATGFGLLTAAMGVGSLISALSTAYLRNVTMRRLLTSGALFSLVLGALGVSTSFWASAILLILVGFAGITCSTTANTLLQLNTPEQLRGRVLSINILLMQGSTPIGGFLMGSLAQLAGVETTLITFAALCLLGIIIAITYHKNPPQVASQVS
jgi:MFS family permease